jgi:succinate-semialdehyde dehydrogenase/glutarate-semialdehyde dehydrogenase
MLTIMQPIGVCAAIAPWNFPILTPAKNCVPAIAAGNTVVLKPAQDTPLTALAMADLARQAGLPKGVFNVIPCLDPKKVGEELCTNKAIKRIAFTGSTEVGREIMRLSSGTIKRLCLELGGNAPFIVFDDAKLDDAVEDAISLKFINSGQVCINPNRFLIQESIYDAFVQKVVEKIRTFKLGSAFDSGTRIIPLINEAGVKKVEGLVEDALKKGARLMFGGKRLDPQKLFYEPTVLTGMTRAMRIHREEIFGPVIACFSFKTEEEALEMANDTEKPEFWVVFLVFRGVCAADLGIFW